MSVQIITNPTGERLVVVPEAEYQALVEAAEDAADIAAFQDFKKRLAAGEEELIPTEMVMRLVAGESPVRVWREHRGLTMAALAERAGIAQPYLSQIETGKRDGTAQTMKKLAHALDVTVDDII